MHPHTLPHTLHTYSHLLALTGYDALTTAPTMAFSSLADELELDSFGASALNPFSPGASPPGTLGGLGFGNGNARGSGMGMGMSLADELDGPGPDDMDMGMDDLGAGFGQPLGDGACGSGRLG